MVGVAGGSRGCVNCKKRKLKCDETFPKCLRCIKSQRDCSGPVVGPMFRKQRVSVHEKIYISSVINESPLSIGHNHDTSRRRSLLVTDGESLTYANRSEVRSYPISTVSIEQSTTQELTFKSTSIPRELMLFPEFDLYNYCLNMFLDRHSVAGHPDRFGGRLNVRTWVDMLPQLVLSHVSSSTTFASRALVISHCSTLYRDPDIALLGSNWYIQALRYQKELVKLMTCSPGYSFRIKRSSERDLDDTVPVEEDSRSLSSWPASSSDSPVATSSIQYLTQWASTDTPSVCKPSKNTTLLPENSSTPLDLPVMTTNLSVSSMRGNMMSYEDDSITAGLLLTIYEVFNSSTNAPWISLLSGANELMRIRGPEAYRTGFNSVIFQSVRGIMAVLALVIRKDTFLNEIEWKNVPWEDSPTGKLIHHYLIDLVLEVPQYQEIVERVLIYSFAKDEVGPINNVANPTKPRPGLRSDYHTREVWALLRETHMKLTDLEARLERWFQEYSHSAREYAREQLCLPLTVTFDPETATANIPQPRCLATISDSEYVATHFFKPIVNYATVHDARIITTYHTTRMIIAYMQQLTARFAYLEFDFSPDLFPGKRHADHDAYVENKVRYLQDIAYIICRSGRYINVNKSNIAVLNILYPLRIAHSVVQDKLERGWIWNELRRIHDIGIRLSLADLHGPYEDEYMSEWKEFKSLDVCPGCGEHVRHVVLDYNDPVLYESFVLTPLGS